MDRRSTFGRNTLAVDQLFQVARVVFAITPFELRCFKIVILIVGMGLSTIFKSSLLTVKRLQDLLELPIRTLDLD